MADREPIYIGEHGSIGIDANGTKLEIAGGVGIDPIMEVIANNPELDYNHRTREHNLAAIRATRVVVDSMVTHGGLMTLDGAYRRFGRLSPRLAAKLEDKRLLSGTVGDLHLKFGFDLTRVGYHPGQILVLADGNLEQLMHFSIHENRSGLSMDVAFIKDGVWVDGTDLVSGLRQAGSNALQNIPPRMPIALAGLKIADQALFDHTSGRYLSPEERTACIWRIRNG